jgi:hypothetical protein
MQVLGRACDDYVPTYADRNILLFSKGHEGLGPILQPVQMFGSTCDGYVLTHVGRNTLSVLRGTKGWVQQLNQQMLGCTCDDCVANHAGRNILLFPRGTKGTGEALSIFLNVPDHESLPPGWVRKASFNLKVIDQEDPMMSVTKGGHSFSRGIVGFSQYKYRQSICTRKKKPRYFVWVTSAVGQAILFGLRSTFAIVDGL